MKVYYIIRALFNKIKNIMKKYIAILCALTLTSCATVTTGQNQSVSVSTGSETGATCSLTNDSGKWYVNSTPGSVTIQRAYSDLTVSCTKGHLTGLKTVKSSTKAMSFGNVIAGGVIGAAVDVGTGSAYDYPNSIDVPLLGN
jgi:hypothetical protein